jgi:hypothetical protein
MKFSIEFGRWTTTKAAIAVAGALAVAGAIGSALAISPILQAPIKWQGGAEFRLQTVEQTLGKAYTVPAGKSFLLTDFTASNPSTTKQFLDISAGPGGSCTFATAIPRVVALIVPPENNAVLALQTGVGFSAGQAVCIYGTAAMNYNGRGFLFTPN